MGTGLITGEVYERRTDELYAADAGVEDAIWKIQNSFGKLPCNPSSQPYAYNITYVNGKRLQISITYVDGSTYKITSIAVTDDGGGTAAITGTAIESYVSALYMDFSSLLDNAIVSDNSIIIKNNVSVTGNVTSGGTVFDKSGDVDGTITQDADLNWPSSEALSAYYLNQVKDGITYYGDTVLDLEGNSCPPGPIYKTTDGIRETVNWPDGLGPLYVNGKLDITSSEQDQEVTLTLNDTIYVTRDTDIYGPNDKEPYRLTIDLNGQTIFVAGASSKSSAPPDAKPALSIEKCNIIGSGCIIAVGDVYFAPKGEVGSEDDFVLVMSVEGTTILQPSGTFYGCIAGNLCVDANSGKDATIINMSLGEGQDLNFPMGTGDDPNELPPIMEMSIESWEVIPLSPGDLSG